MSVLITGGMGAVGSAVARHLVNEGTETILYNRFEDHTLINDIKDKVIFAAGDILDLEKLVETIKKYDVKRIVHTAANYSKTKKLLKINTEGTVNVLWAAAKCEIERVVYTSSKAVYNEPKGRHGHPLYEPINEDYPKDEPMGFYGVTKLFGEQVGHQFYKNYGVDFVALRFSTIYGPGRLVKNPKAAMVIPCRIIENGMLGKPFNYPKGREQRDDYIYIKDVAYGISLACFARDLTHRTFNIGTGVPSSLLDFAESVRKIYPDFEAEIGPGLDPIEIGFNCYNVYDISRAKGELGYRPQYNIDNGVADYIQAMRDLNIRPTWVE